MRLDLIDPLLGGNKWFKLQHNIDAIKEAGNPLVVTFGGAWSNHLRAVAAAGQRFGFATAGLVRGEIIEPLNPSLALARDCGMQLRALSREQYRRKQEPGFEAWLESEFGAHYLLPEGGSNEVGVRGCEALADYFCWQAESKQRVVVLACGTGATMAGLIRGLQQSGQGASVLGVSVLRAPGYISAQVRHWLADAAATNVEWRVIEDAHCGGYARQTPELLHFMEQFQLSNDIPLEPVYTGKLLFALQRQLELGALNPGGELIVVHSGGILPKSPPN